MTDDMTIKQRPSALPYMAGGAVVGAGAGYAVDRWALSKPMSHEDIVKKMNDADAFTKNTAEGAEHAASWKEVQAKAQAVEEAKAAVTNAEKPVLPTDNKLAQEFETVTGEYEKAISEKTAEKTITKKAGSNIVPANDSWKMTVAERNNYNNLYSQWEAAVQAFESDPKVTQLTKDIADRKLEYGMFYDEIVNDAEKEIKATAGKKPSKRIKNFAEYLEKGNGEDFIHNQIKKNNYHHLTNEELIRHAGGEKKLSATKPSFGFFEKKTAIEVTKADGTKAWAVFGDKELKNLKTQKADRIFKDITETLEAYSKNTNKLNNLHENVKFDKDVLKRAGLTQTTTRGVKGHAYLAKDGSALDFKAFVNDCTTNAKQYADDARVLFDNGVHNAKIPAGATSVTYAPEVQNILTKYGVSSPKELYNELVAKQSIGNKFAAEKATVEKAIHDILARDTQLANLEGQMSNLRKGAKNVRNLEQQIRGQFGRFLGKPGATTETVAGMTREEAIKALEGTDLAKKFKKLQGEVEKAAKELGAVDQTKLNSAKEALTKAEGEFKSATEALGKKLGKSGNKWLAIGIGAAALGLGALTLRPKAEA